MSLFDPAVIVNDEKYLHDNHWQPTAEVDITQAATDTNLGSPAGAGKTLRIRELTIRHEGTNATVVTLKVAGAQGAVKLTIDVPAQTTRLWSSEDGREFATGEQPAVQSSDITGGETHISAAGVEA